MPSYQFQINGLYYLPFRIASSLDYIKTVLLSVFLNTDNGRFDV